MSTNDNRGTRRLSQIRPIIRHRIPPQRKRANTADEINRETRLQQIELNLCRALHRIDDYLMYRPQKELAKLAIELSRLDGKGDPFSRLRDAARLWREAGSAIAWDRDTRPREEAEAREKEFLQAARSISDEPHPYKPGEFVNPDDLVPYALFVSNGSGLRGVEPPCPFRNGKKPPVPWYKTEDGFLDFLRYVAVTQHSKKGALPTPDEIERIATGILANAKADKLAVHRYEELLWHFQNKRGEQTDLARAARAAKAAQKRDAKAQADAQKPVKQKRTRKSDKETTQQKHSRLPTEVQTSPEKH